MAVDLDGTLLNGERQLLIFYQRDNQKKFQKRAPCYHHDGASVSHGKTDFYRETRAAYPHD